MILSERQSFETLPPPRMDARCYNQMVVVVSTRRARWYVGRKAYPSAILRISFQPMRFVSPGPVREQT